jgi:hypothetical protein
MVPAYHGGRLDHDQGRTPTRPQPGQAQPEQAVAATQRGPRPSSGQHGQLLTQSQILQHELAARQQEQVKKSEDGVKAFHGWLERSDTREKRASPLPFSRRRFVAGKRTGRSRGDWGRVSCGGW